MALTKPTAATVLTVFGTASDDYILGTSSDDTITGGVAALAYSTDGSDSMEGGLGDDWYIVNDTTDVITEYAGEGIDTVFARVSYTLATELENIVASGTTAVTLTGNAKDNILDGSQNSVADTLIGGAGNDTYILSSTDKINADSAGTDTVMASFTVNISSAAASTNFAANSATVIENVTLIDGSAANITGNGLNNRLTGNASNNSIIGGAGNDILDTGTAGTDSLDGGAGNDTYIIRSGATVSSSNITDSAGTDTVKSFAIFDASAVTAIENITLLGSSNIDATGNASNNILIGNAGVNTITGGAGNDTITGGGSADSLVGGTGNDTYNADATDTVTEEASQGTDLVQLGGTTTTAFTLSDNVESLTMSGSLALKASASASTTAHSMKGNIGINQLTGGSGNDTLDGGVGADALTGGAGNDLFYLDNTGDTVADSAGTDSVVINPASTFTTSTFTVSGAFESITLAGSTNLKLTTVNTSTTFSVNGNTGSNTLDGSSSTGKGTFAGNGGDDSITGGDGNDTLNGGTGTDTMAGGTGDDKYYVDSSNDLVSGTKADGSGTAVTDDGTDSVESSVSFVLGTNVENLTLSATAPDGTGNALANILNGNSSNNTLSGLAAADTIIGGAGDDTITGGDGIDSVTGGTGADTFILQGVLVANADNITDFSVSQSDILAFDISSMALNAGDYSAGAVTIIDAAAATDLAVGAAASNIIVDTLANIAAMTDADSAWTGGAIAIASDTGNIYWDANADFSAGLLIVGSITASQAALLADGNLSIVA